LDENQIASLNQLLHLFKEKITTMPRIYFSNCLSNIQFVPNADNKVDIIDCFGIEESDIPILMHFLASPRADGKQRVMKMHFWEGQLPVAQKLLDAIKEVWKSSVAILLIFCRSSAPPPDLCHNHFVFESNPISIFPKVRSKTRKPMKH
jgi:hypothetical protein